MFNKIERHEKINSKVYYLTYYFIMYNKMFKHDSKLKILSILIYLI